MKRIALKNSVCVRLCAAVITVVLLTGYLPAVGQLGNITVQREEITIKQVFALLEVQTRYNIAYNQTKFDADRTIRIDVKDVSLDSVLSVVLKDTGFTWKLNGKHIVIIAKDTAKKAGNEGETVRQTIRGLVTDKASGAALAYATVALLLSDGPRGTTSDSLGGFEFTDLPVGRYDLRASSVGYEPALLREVLLTSGKETFCRVALQEQLVRLDEVIVRSPVFKDQTLNPFSLTGGRMVSMEEAGRYAGGFDDPARLVTSFAGVAGNFSTNSIAVRGNSPQFLQWKLEGVEVPNPTHFADVSGIGGGIFSALSSQVMGNSDFFNGAFPAEYSNALSGVFDMSMRTGNNQEYEHTVAISTLGIDVASEGPFSRKHRGSYIFNYRYSTTGLIKAAIADMELEYQDLSFKLNFPTLRAGTFSVWGIGLKDANQAEAEKDTLKWESIDDRVNSSIRMMKLAGGINHKYVLASGAYVKTSLAATFTKDHMSAERYTLEDKQLIPTGDVKQSNYNFVLSSYVNRKFGARHTNRTGFTVTGLLYDMDYYMSPDWGGDLKMEQIARGDGFNAVVSAFSNSVIRLNPALTATVGVTAQLFTLNNHWTLEPRVALKWKMTQRQTISLAYGLHSRHERLDYYYIKTPESGDRLVNKQLDFAKAHHLVLSYGFALSPLLLLKIEPYYQYLYDVPVEPGSSFSVINHDMWYLERALVNAGKGRNYGVDVTLERYLNRGYYYLFTGSVFKSEYCGGDGIWRDTRMNRAFLFNMLGGKEWMCGRRKQNVFSANLRLSYQGGDRYTPVDEAASDIAEIVKFDESKAFSERFDPVLTADITLSYRINRKKLGHEFGLKLLNATGSSGLHGFEYNDLNRKVEKINIDGMFLPNISYKIQF